MVRWKFDILVLARSIRLRLFWIRDPLSGRINSGHGSSERGAMAGWIWSIIEIPD
jgi:hypothetical protein